MIQKKIPILLFLSLIIVGCTSSPPESPTTEAISEELSKQVLPKLPEKSDIVILGFYDHTSGELHNANDALTSDLTYQFLNSTREDLQIINRSMLNEALDELKFYLSELSDTEKAQQIGSFLSADILIKGTVYEDFVSIECTNVETLTLVAVGKYTASDRTLFADTPEKKSGTTSGGKPGTITEKQEEGQKEDDSTLPQRDGYSNTVVSMVTDESGLENSPFNKNTHKGLEKAEEEFGVSTRVAESTKTEDYSSNLRALAQDGSDLVFAVGYSMQEAITEVAKEYPHTDFAGIDIHAGPDDPDNYKGVLYKEEQAGYLAGIVAGMMTEKYADRSNKLNSQNKLGIVRGKNIPPVKNYEVGFIAGVRRVNPECQIFTETANDFNDRAKGKTIATRMIDKGADIVFQIAGYTGIGVIEGAQERGRLAIGPDYDHNSVAPDTVITSAIKKFSESVFYVVKEVVEGNFRGGTTVYGLKHDAVGIAPFHSFENVVPQEVKDEITKAKEEILSGKIDIKK